MKSIGRLMRRFSGPSPGETVRSRAADLDVFLGNLADLARASQEQVAWADVRSGRTVVVGASVRHESLFYIVDAEGDRPQEFQDEDPNARATIRQRTAQALEEVLASTGTAVGAMVAVSIAR